jgi:hypothetical protein
MKRQHRTIFLVTALVLIPVLFALTPLNFVQKLASGAPLSPVKPILQCNPCPFHSVTSQPDALQIDVVWAPLEPRALVSLVSVATARDVIPSCLLPDPLPLRC